MSIPLRRINRLRTPKSG